jgi:putative flippase GtrA
MNLSMSGLIAHARTDDGLKKLRYAGVSVVFVPIGQTLIQIFGLWLDNYTAASLLSQAVVTLPSFFANKHFVWRFTPRANLHKQIVVFWVAVMLGTSLATLLTHLVENAMSGQTRLILGVSVVFVQLFGYGIVWVGRFLLLDRWLFKLVDDASNHPDEATDDQPALNPSSHSDREVEQSARTT